MVGLNDNKAVGKTSKRQKDKYSHSGRRHVQRTADVCADLLTINECPVLLLLPVYQNQPGAVLHRVQKLTPRWDIAMSDLPIEQALVATHVC